MWRRYASVGESAWVKAAPGAPSVDVTKLADRRLAHIMPRATEAPLTRKRIYVTLLATGFLGIGYEVLGVLAIGQALQDTVYTFAAALGVYLLGTAIGGSIHQVLLRRFPARSTLVHLFQGLAVACLLGVMAISQAHEINRQAMRVLGSSLLGAVGAEAVVAASVFLLPTIFMGAIFSLLAQSARGERRGIGVALGINTLGGFLAAPLLGVGLLPVLGAKWALALVSAAYLGLMPQTTRVRLIPAAVAVAALAVLPFISLRLVEAPRGGRVVSLSEGVMGAVAVVTDAEGHRFLKVNNEFQMGGTSTTFAEKRQAMIPLLLHPKPRTALFLGIGTGVTLGAGAIDADIHCDGVELVPGVVAALEKFAPENLGPAGRPNVTIHTADARRFVRTAPAEYDVIIADLFHPARDGAGSLYTLEHFRAVRSRLAEDGLFCQWLPLYQLDTPTFQTIARTFLKVFEPEAVRVCMAHFNGSTPMIGLLGWLTPAPIDADELERRIASAALAAELPVMAIQQPLDVLGCLVTTGTDLVRLVGSGPINTDDRPVVMYTAPRLAYDDREPPSVRLERLLGSARTEGAALLGDDAAIAGVLGPYLKARDLFIKAATQEAAQAMRAPAGKRESGGLTPPVVEAYLASVRASPDFRASYVRLLAGAEAVAQADAERARQILAGLMEADPTRPDAGILLRRLSAVDQGR
jgi:spermidine synthase